ncbi:succinate semialdehyde dehydrogenase NADP+ linked [Rhizina undulata]
MVDSTALPYSLAADDKVIIIGCGPSGIAMGTQLLRRLNHKNFEIYDKNPSAGGAWYQNHYPNLSCDTPSHYYSFSFNLNPLWSQRFATQKEILNYLYSTISKFRLGDHIKTGQKCHGARWDEAGHLWAVVLQDLESGKSYVRTARVLITAVGVLSTPRGIEEIVGHEGFGGVVMHTAEWRDDVEWTGKRVAVVGNGCSANQVVPAIVEKVGEQGGVVQVFRSEHWVAKKGDFYYSTFFKTFLHYIPLAARIYRLSIAVTKDIFFPNLLRNPSSKQPHTQTETTIKNYMMATASSQYHEILLPSYPFGAKCPVLDHGYLAATHSPNLRLIKSSKFHLEGNELVDDHGGGRYNADILVLANGFKAQALGLGMKIFGEGKQELGKVWKEGGGASAYRGVAVPGFPNLFMISGPNTLPTANSTLVGIECSVIYVLRLLPALLPPHSIFRRIISWMFQRKPYTSIEAKEEPTKAYNEWIQGELAKMVFNKDTANWYTDMETGRNTLTWPGTQFLFWWDRCVRRVRWGDWEVKRAVMKAE